MASEIIVNAGPGETRVAIQERGNFVELHIERTGELSMVGSVVKGRVTRVLPGMQAAFVDIGLEKAAFLYVGDYLEEYDPGEVEVEGAEQSRPRRGRGRGRNGNGRSTAAIESLLSEGQEVVVQVAKEPIGTKGARITSHVSIPGRHLVLTPWAQRIGVSRRIESDRERRRLREVIERVRPRDLGFIIRTAGDGTRVSDLEADVKYLTEVWDEIQIRKDQVRAPYVLYRELPLPLRMIRDAAGGETKRIVVDSQETFEQMEGFVARFLPPPGPRLERYTGTTPVFDHFGLETQIDDNLGRKVWLKSGGHLIFDQSEALTAIDVNTGRYVGKRDLEETVLRTNLEAVKEVVHQLRFRNIGGLIIIDLIDMESSENRDKVYRAFQEALRGDKARTNLLKISELGLVEMTRKRTRESLVQTLCEPCPYCGGRSYVLSAESVACKVLREIRKDLPRFRGRRVAVTTGRRVAELLLGPEREALASLERELGRELEIRIKPGLHHEQFEVTALGPGPAVEFTPTWLTPPEQGSAEPEALEEPLPEEPGPAEEEEERREAVPEEADASAPLAEEAEPELAVVDDGPESRILPDSEKPEES